MPRKCFGQRESLGTYTPLKTVSMALERMGEWGIRFNGNNLSRLQRRPLSIRVTIMQIHANAVAHMVRKQCIRECILAQIESEP